MQRIIYIVAGFLSLAGICRAQGGADVFRHGKLDNGLTYYVRHTSMQQGYADFYLIQNVGALMEEDNQNGLAHFLEHMAFNGTVNFPNASGVQEFLKRRGVTQFNAYTGQDETVYHINRVTTGAQGLVDSCLLILRDWSGFLLLNPKEIDKERGVIFEERRSTRNVGTRMQEQANKYIYNGSKYATHDVIGLPEVLANFTPTELRSYYQDFYRPDQQAVVVVGDIDVDKVEQQIKALFAPIPKRINPKPRIVYEIPDNVEPLYCVATDKEVPSPSISIMKRIRVQQDTSLREMLKKNLIRTFYNSMVSKRLQQYVDAGSPDFIGASVNYGKLVRNYETYNILVKPVLGMDRQALRQLLEQLEIIDRFGFTEQELKGQISQYLKGLDDTEKMKDKLSNSVYVTIYQNNFLLGKPITNVDEDIALSREILSSLTLNDVYAWAESWKTPNKNLVFLMDGNDPNYHFLTKDDVVSLMDSVKHQKLNPVNYDIEAVPLVDFEIKGGRIVKEKEIKALGAWCWTLDNGCRVYFKPTSRDRGRVSLLGESYGGKSILDAKDLPSAEAMTSLVLRSGLYKHNQRMLEEILKKHNVSVNLRLGETVETVSGTSAVEDGEMMFQLLYLLFEKPRFDENDFNKFLSLSKMELRTATPGVMQEVNRAVQKLRMKESPRLWDSQQDSFFDAMSYNKMVQIYKDRFRDASDFRFYIAGDITVEQAKEWVSHYLGAIPSIYRKETYKWNNLRKEGSIKEEVTADIPDDKYIVNVEYYNHLKMTPKDELCLSILQKVLQDRYNAEIREEQGGSYGVSVESSSSDFPQLEQFIGVSFQTSLEKGDQMRDLVQQIIGVVVNMGVSDEEVEDAVLMMKKSFENMKKNRGNGYWMEALRSYVDEGKNIESPVYFENIIDKVDGKAIQVFAKKFFKDVECKNIVIKSKK